jgi:arginyl-tRNA synthetase
MHIFANIKKIVTESVATLAKAKKIKLNEAALNKLTIEQPRDKSFGCIATNAAMICAKEFQMSPRDLATDIIAQLEKLSENIEKISVAGPGFINISFKDSFWQNHLLEIINDKNFAKLNIGKGEKVNIEFASPNPTGPVHIGHSRGAIYGDVLASILENLGYDVTRENYINDAGGQIDILAQSLYLRYVEVATNKPQIIPQGLYPGEYLIPVAKEIFRQSKDKYLAQDFQEIKEEFKLIAVKNMLELIKAGLADLGVVHDVHFSEKKLHEANKIKEVIELLGNKQHTYIGVLPKPKGKAGENWQEREQLLFKAKEFGDDVDRALQKSDGSWTYFAADAAYHLDKIQRGFNKMILILGADHGGYIKRMQALIKALSDSKAEINIKICQLVNLQKHGENIKMSKRDGNFVTVSELVEMVGKDVLRFIMLTRKNDALLDLDVELAVSQSKDNPVFYIQYAHARICSVMRKVSDFDINKISNKHLQTLSHPAELELIKTISIYPQIISNIAKNYEPHHLAFYLQDLAGQFHAYWNLGKTENNLRFISDDQLLSNARLALIMAVRRVIKLGLGLFNIQALEEMR